MNEEVLSAHGLGPQQLRSLHLGFCHVLAAPHGGVAACVQAGLACLGRYRLLLSEFLQDQASISEASSF